MHTFWFGNSNSAVEYSELFRFVWSLCLHTPTPTCASLRVLFCVFVQSCSRSYLSYSSGFFMYAFQWQGSSQLFWVSYITGLHFWPQGSEGTQYWTALLSSAVSLSAARITKLILLNYDLFISSLYLLYCEVFMILKMQIINLFELQPYVSRSTFLMDLLLSFLMLKPWIIQWLLYLDTFRLHKMSVHCKLAWWFYSCRLGEWACGCIICGGNTQPSE